ncbi:phage portal protein [Kitasatospora albolonga]|uniref:phage portal protein n=1 Tax=Kitasatospora albolonga TaxID=68173 RepID=UPI0031ECFBE0
MNYFDQLRQEHAAGRGRLARIADYYDGNHPLPTLPEDASADLKEIAGIAVTNYMDTIVHSIAENLNVVSYGGDSRAWDAFRASRMETLQDAVHSSALTFGASYVSVLPGARGPVVRPHSPLEMVALYDDPVTDMWPVAAATCRRVRTLTGTGTEEEWSVFTPSAVSIYRGRAGAAANGMRKVGGAKHSLGVVPVVRFVNEQPMASHLPPRSEIEPLFPIQRQINLLKFDQIVAGRFGAFPQKFITGPTLPEGMEDATKTGPDRVMALEGESLNVGSFDAATLEQYIAAEVAATKKLATKSRVPLSALDNAVSNLSAEAMAALEIGLMRKVEDRQQSFGTAWSQALWLAEVAAGGRPAGLSDVQWSDPRSKNPQAQAQAMSGWKAAGVPLGTLMRRFGDFTEDEIREAQASSSRLDDMAGELLAGAGVG